MPDTTLEHRLREAIAWAEHENERHLHHTCSNCNLNEPVKISLVDAKRFLLRIKQENEKGDRLVYRRDEAKSTR